MTANRDSGFRELSHTADWALQVWAPDLPALLAQAAGGMYALMELEWRPEESCRRSFDLTVADDEGLLVAFLSELLYLLEDEQLAFDRFDLDIGAGRLHACLQGRTVAAIGKEIKAVTYHNLLIRSGADGMETIITFDV